MVDHCLIRFYYLFLGHQPLDLICFEFFKVRYVLYFALYSRSFVYTFKSFLFFCMFLDGFSLLFLRFFLSNFLQLFLYIFLDGFILLLLCIFFEDFFHFFLCWILWPFIIYLRHFALFIVIFSTRARDVYITYWCVSDTLRHIVSQFLFLMHFLSFNFSCFEFLMHPN